MNDVRSGTICILSSRSLTSSIIQAPRGHLRAKLQRQLGLGSRRCPSGTAATRLCFHNNGEPLQWRRLSASGYQGRFLSHCEPSEQIVFSSQFRLNILGCEKTHLRLIWWEMEPATRGVYTGRFLCVCVCTCVSVFQTWINVFKCQFSSSAICVKSIMSSVCGGVCTCFDERLSTTCAPKSKSIFHEKSVWHLLMIKLQINCLWCFYGCVLLCVCVLRGGGVYLEWIIQRKSRLFSGGEGKDTSETYGRKSHWKQWAVN